MTAMPHAAAPKRTLRQKPPGPSELSHTTVTPDLDASVGENLKKVSAVSAVAGLSLREFARREGCDEKLVRTKIRSGHLKALPDGSISPALVGTPWRKGKSRSTAKPTSVEIDGKARTKAEAEVEKEYYLARLRRLEFEEKAGQLVRIEDVSKELTRRLHIVRTKLLSLPPRLAPLMLGISTPSRAHQKLQAGVNELIWELNDAALQQVNPDHLTPAERAKFDELVERKERERDRNALLPE